jgi:uncharacterized membrane protein
MSLIQKRDTSVDTLRGIAIVTMIAANLSATFLVQPHPLWIRLYGSFAAPLFILISGMMVEYTAKAKGYGLRHFAGRGLMIIAVAVLVDVLVWRIYPFTTMDILYLIGISTPIAYLCGRLKPSARWIIIACTFLATPILQLLLGYTDYPSEFTLLGQPTLIVLNQTSILNHWLVDGWFPIFPWLGFSLLGTALAGNRWGSDSKQKITDIGTTLAGLGAVGSGALIWWLYPGSLLVRAGYSELFYPPTLGYLLTSAGLVILLFGLVDKTSSSRGYVPLRTLGRVSLFIYILHLVLIEYLFGLFFQPSDLGGFLFVYVATLIIMMIVSFLLEALKARRKFDSYLARFLLGG